MTLASHPFQVLHTVLLPLVPLRKLIVGGADMLHPLILASLLVA